MHHTLPIAPFLSALTLAVLLVAVGGCQQALPPAPEPASPSTSTPLPQVELTISAAISLRDALEEMKAAYTERHPNITLVSNLGASGQLQLQIEQGAPVDVFLSAAQAQMDALERKNLLLAGSRRDFAANRLVLVVPAQNGPALSRLDDLTRPEVQRIAIGNPVSVPAGAYAKEVLTRLGLWKQVESRLVFGENVRQVLTYVELGNADAGLVYATDAATSTQAQTVAHAPDDVAPAIRYPAAAVATTRHPQEAAAFVAFLTAPEGQSILRKHGFLEP